MDTGQLTLLRVVVEQPTTGNIISLDSTKLSLSIRVVKEWVDQAEAAAARAGQDLTTSFKLHLQEACKDRKESVDFLSQHLLKRPNNTPPRPSLSSVKSVQHKEDGTRHTELTNRDTVVEWRSPEPRIVEEKTIAISLEEMALLHETETHAQTVNLRPHTVISILNLIASP
ncbi:MAG: hypothetical protein WC045_01930 [Patescibacteria group bacterium]